VFYKRAFRDDADGCWSGPPEQDVPSSLEALNGSGERLPSFLTQRRSFWFFDRFASTTQEVEQRPDAFHICDLSTGLPIFMLGCREQRRPPQSKREARDLGKDPRRSRRGIPEESHLAALV
jgi:hypothetical protein